jgi:flagellar motor switch protein FliM
LSAPILAGAGDKTPCGVILLPIQSAIAWTSRLLGGQAGEIAVRELTALELSLVGEIMGTLGGTLQAVARGVSGPAFGVSEQIAQEKMPFIASPTTEYCRFAFSAGSEGSAGSEKAGLAFAYVIQTSQLAGIYAPQAGKTAPQPGQSAKAMLAHMGGASVMATACLGSAVATVREIMDLEPGDIMLLQNRMGEPIELSVQGTVVMVGLPVETEGHYGLEVVESISQASQATN